MLVHLRAASTSLLIAIALTAGCGPVNVQQQAGFGRTDIRAAKSTAEVGEIVRFDLRPPVSRGTEWDLDTYNRVRFVGGEDSTHRFWVAEHDPIHLETIVPPWTPKTEQEKTEDTGWLWFALRDSGEKEPIRRSVPVVAEPSKEIAPVAFTSVFSTAEKNPRLWHTRTAQRHEVTFKTVTEKGVPRLPRVRAALVQTTAKKVLYAEIHLDLGYQQKEDVGYETTLSYPLTVEGPVDVVVVEWVGHGDYFGPFRVHRLRDVE